MSDKLGVPTAPDLGLDEYEILGELGRGGASVVYEARDRVLGRNVAIKVSRDAYLQDPESIARFEREARVLASLHHPKIVTLYAAKRLPAGSLALVMQHGNWRTLKRAIREDAPFSPERIEGVLRDVGEALAYLHHRGVVHRDIKPENIFVDRETGHALLSDFGIAKYGDGRASVTLTGVVIGTPVYMSPEQIDGAELDGRSDLYSLGMVGYEMVTGRRPWDGESLYTVIFKQKNDRLPPLRSLRPDVSPALCMAIEGAIEKMPEDRWPSAEALLVQLSGSPPELAEEAPPAEAPAPAAPAPAVPRVVAVAPEAAPALPPEAPAPPVKEPVMIQIHRIVSEEDASISAAVSSRWARRRLMVTAAVVVILAGGVGAIALASDWVPPPAGDVRAQPRESAQREAASPASRAPAPAADPVSVGPVALQAGLESEVQAASSVAVAVPAPAATSRMAARGDARRVPAPAASQPDSQPGVDDILGLPIPALDVARPEQGGARRPAGSPVVLSYSRAPEVRVAAPQLVNRTYVAHVMSEMYPRELRDKGVGGTVMVSLLVTENGTVVASTVATTSGRVELDSAAVRIGRMMKFSPSATPNLPRRVWVTMPLTFEGRS